MSNLQKRQEIIQEKRKNTPWRDFVMEIASWQQFNFYKRSQGICRYPDTKRIDKLVHADNFFQTNEWVSCDYDDNKTFFENYEALRSQIHFPQLWIFWSDNENSQFADTIYNSKNCYLCVSTAFNVENMLYSLECHGNLNQIISSTAVHSNSSNVFQSAWVADSFEIFYSYNIQNSSNLWFCGNMIWCSNCIRCNNLINQSYCIDNQQFTKEEFMQKSKQILKDKSPFDELYGMIDRHTPAMLGCDDVENGKFVSYVHKAHNICMVWWDNEAKRSDLFDVWSSGGNIQGAYGCMGVSPWDNFYCVVNSGFVHNVFYSYFVTNCSFCLGCIWLQNKSYCILNKQYTKEDWHEKVDEIFSQMQKDGTLGEFFPATMNPFYFNDTAAYLIDPSFTKEEVTAKWYLRRDEPIKVDIPAWVQTIKTKELKDYEWWDSEWNWNISDEILKKVILDPQGNAYRIIPMELEFLRKYELPLPRKHRLDRMKENFRIN